MLMSIVFFCLFFVFFIFSYYCDTLHFFVTPFWLAYVHILSIVRHSIVFNFAAF